MAGRDSKSSAGSHRLGWRLRSFRSAVVLVSRYKLDFLPPHSHPPPLSAPVIASHFLLTQSDRFLLIPFHTSVPQKRSVTSASQELNYA